MATILVVDDESVIHHLMRRILERLGHAVVLAGNGREALDRLAETPVDITLAPGEADGLVAVSRASRASIPAPAWAASALGPGAPDSIPPTSFPTCSAGSTPLRVPRIPSSARSR